MRQDLEVLKLSTKRNTAFAVYNT